MGHREVCVMKRPAEMFARAPIFPYLAPKRRLPTGNRGDNVSELPIPAHAGGTR